MKTHCEICNENFKSEEALAMHNFAKHKNAIIEQKGNSNKLFWGFIAGFILVVIGIILYFSFASAGNSGNVSGNVAGGNGDVQKVNIGFSNYNYYPRTITVKQGIPVEITLDNSVGGCYRSFNIPAMGVSKRSSGPSDIIKFTPTEKGTYPFRCSMGMGTGTIVVE